MYEKGFILAINSKNNEENVMEVFDKHPDMVLKPNNFAVMKINWQNKAQNMLEIAQELNIGIDSLVFFDDSPAEIDLIKQKLPEVQTVHLSCSPIFFPRILEELDYFERLKYTKEDMTRGQMYTAQIKRSNLEKSSLDIEDFYKSLEMKATIKQDDNFSISRLSMMTQKTNQFNLTTKRYSESDIKQFIKSKDYKLFSLKLEDKFGDNGIVGLVIIRIKNQEWLIDTFLLSCRVMGRTIETSILSHIVDMAKKENARRIIGQYIATDRNIPVKNLYKDHKFESFTVNENDYWEANPDTISILNPLWIDLIVK